MSELRQRQPRIRNEAYLKWLRQQPCGCGCGKPPPSDAAHLRAGSILYKKDYPGFGAKPGDAWAMPLNRSCHMRQHALGDELLFWSMHGVYDPFGRSMRYYAAWETECLSKGRKPSKSTKKRASRKLPSRPFSKQKRKFGS